jgi:Tfp pilus assembly protein PilO
MVELEKMGDKLVVSQAIKERAAYIYRKALERGLLRGRSITGIAAAALYAAFRDTETPRTIKDVAAVSNLNRKAIARDYRILVKEMNLTMPVADAAKNVHRIGSKVGLENILFQPQPEVVQEFYAVIPIKLDLVGTFNDLGVFLDSISKLDRILKVESLTLTRQKGKQESLLQVGCNIVTYRFLEKPQPKAGGKK